MADELTYLQGLLTQIRGINDRYAEVNKVYESSGIRYNIFDVLGLTSSEVGLHSTFIASLLRPEQHGAGTKFLEAFLRMSKLDLPSDFFNVSKVQVEQEKYIGPTTEKEGGRIDLILTDGNSSLIIENKIYADDQKNQLLRYHNYRPTARLVYLSLFGDEPSGKSLGTLSKESVTCISYKIDIIQWLEECVQISANLPYIRETINQYIRTIQQLTNTSMATNTEVIGLLKEQNNLAAAFAIRDNLDHALNEIMKTFIENLKRDIEQSCPNVTCTVDHTSNDTWFVDRPRFLFKHSGWKHVFFAMEFEHSGLKDFTHGFLKKDEVKDIRQLKDVKEFAHKLGYDKKSTGSWFWSYPSSPEILNWNNAKTMGMLRDGSMIKWFVETVNNVISCSKGFDL